MNPLLRAFADTYLDALGVNKPSKARIKHDTEHVNDRRRWCPLCRTEIENNRKVKDD